MIGTKVGSTGTEFQYQTIYQDNRKNISWKDGRIKVQILSKINHNSAVL